MYYLYVSKFVLKNFDMILYLIFILYISFFFFLSFFLVISVVGYFFTCKYNYIKQTEDTRYR